jgi:hypothetical protein
MEVSDRIPAMQTQLHLQMDHSKELTEEIAKSGPLSLFTQPPMVLTKPDVKDAGKWLPSVYQTTFLKDALHTLNESAVLSCTFDPNVVSAARVKQTLEHTSLLFQLVKPRRLFSEDWFELGPTSEIGACSRDLASLPVRIAGASAYLEYQQHHTITLADIETVKQCLPRLQTALDPGTSSWNHPCGPVHRALILFAEGYSSTQFGELRQFLWAMALDCLFSSKLNKQKRGGRLVTQRLKTLFGAEYEPYSGQGIRVPINQKRPNHKLTNIGEDIFLLRNACAHGLPIRDAWLSVVGKPASEGYAYQLCECTEILLRQTLLLILAEQRLFDVFVDAQKLDRYFG